jgi:hypothetical protein
MMAEWHAVTRRDSTELAEVSRAEVVEVSRGLAWSEASHAMLTRCSRIVKACHPTCPRQRTS